MSYKKVPGKSHFSWQIFREYLKLIFVYYAFGFKRKISKKFPSNFFPEKFSTKKLFVFFSWQTTQDEKREKNQLWNPNFS